MISADHHHRLDCLWWANRLIVIPTIQKVSFPPKTKCYLVYKREYIHTFVIRSLRKDIVHLILISADHHHRLDWLRWANRLIVIPALQKISCSKKNKFYLVYKGEFIHLFHCMKLVTKKILKIKKNPSDTWEKFPKNPFIKASFFCGNIMF